MPTTVSLRHLSAVTRPLPTATKLTFCAILALLILLPCEARAQLAPSLSSQEPPIRVAVEPAYQSVSHDGQTLTQWSTRIFAAVPVTRRLQTYLRASAAESGGDGLSSVQGLDDVQLGGTYAQALPRGSLVFGLDVTVPTGKRNLSPTEWRTAIATSQDVYDFRVSSFGQGLNAEPRVTWAVPVSRNVIVGIGASYTYRGRYEPSSAIAGAYNPGNEIGAFGGVDVRVGRASALSADVSVTRFGTDTVEGEDRFEARHRLAGTLQYLYQQGFTSVRVVGRLQHWPASRFYVPGLGVGADPVTTTRQVVPSEYSLRATAAMRVAGGLDLRVGLSGHRFDDTASSDAITIGTVRLAPAFHLPGGVFVTPGVAYSAGASTASKARSGRRYASERSPSLSGSTLGPQPLDVHALRPSCNGGEVWPPIADRSSVFVSGWSQSDPGDRPRHRPESTSRRAEFTSSRRMLGRNAVARRSSRQIPGNEEKKPVKRAIRPTAAAVRATGSFLS